MRQDEIIAENSPSPTTNTQINASGTPVSPIDTPLAIYFYKYFEGLKINDIKEILNKHAMVAWFFKAFGNNINHLQTVVQIPLEDKYGPLYMDLFKFVALRSYISL